jgi:UDP-2,3-diacylglucosamine hydrolase
MKIAAISDVHVKKPFDDADKLLTSFLHHRDVESADVVLLLGDIFDLMCGPHEVYLELFHHQFQRITQLTQSGKRVYFFEGNHDVHLERLFKKIWKNNEVILSQTPVIEELDGKLYYYSHGDEHEIDNKSYQRYIKLIRSSPLKFVANHLMPYQVLSFLGERASKMSRKKGAKTFQYDVVRDRFRSGVSHSTLGKYDFILGGHSHVQDKFLIPNSNSLYVNNGYALKTRTFILIENHEVSFIPLF